MNTCQNKPYVLEVESGESKAFCMCGLSQNAPLCDGSHAATDIRPKIVTFDQGQKVVACGCQQSSNRPYCTGDQANMG